MNPNVLVAAITAGSSMAIAITALFLNSRGFSSIERQIGMVEGRIGSLGRRIEVIEQDLKQFFRSHAEFDRRLQRVEDKQQGQ